MSVNFTLNFDSTNLKCVNFNYHIRQHFWGTQFSRIAISKPFAENIFPVQKFQVYSILKFPDLNFRRLLRIRKNNENYEPRIFGRMRWFNYTFREVFYVSDTIVRENCQSEPVSNTNNTSLSSALVSMMKQMMCWMTWAPLLNHWCVVKKSPVL